MVVIRADDRGGTNWKSLPQHAEGVAETRHHTDLTVATQFGWSSNYILLKEYLIT
jgi:hypothetical protein